MKETDFKVVLWGTQGSVAVNSAKKARYGCNTSCVSAECGGDVFVFDMATGFLPFSDYFLQKYKLPKSIDIFLSHYHQDHIEGLPFAGVSYDPGVSMVFHSQPSEGKSPEEILIECYSPPVFPVNLIREAPPGKFSFDTISPGQSVSTVGGKIIVKSLLVSHPGGSISYRLEYNGRSLCYLSDFEYGNGLSAELLEFLSGADLVVFDAYFTNATLLSGWGHSSWEQGVEVWREAGIKKLAMYHHHINATDEDLDALAAKLAAISDDLIVAKDGMEIFL
ncbi:MAG: MBL fold metallo-hydrolase [Oscillospiraceae bacterium]|nr:MBL fold metallo-hydrolase [Oscillospiraceae bacterium]